MFDGRRARVSAHVFVRVMVGGCRDLCEPRKAQSLGLNLSILTEMSLVLRNRSVVKADIGILLVICALCVLGHRISRLNVVSSSR